MRATPQLGPDLQRTDLASEAIRLTRAIHRSLPDDGEVAGLLALMLLTDARRAARTDPEGGLIPLAEQDRTRWDSDMIEEGAQLVTDATLPLAARPVPAAGGDRLPARGGAPRDGHRLAADPRFLYQVLVPDRAESHGHAQSTRSRWP